MIFRSMGSQDFNLSRDMFIEKKKKVYSYRPSGPVTCSLHVKQTWGVCLSGVFPSHLVPKSLGWYFHLDEFPLYHKNNQKIDRILKFISQKTARKIIQLDKKHCTLHIKEAVRSWPNFEVLTSFFDNHLRKCPTQPAWVIY